MKDQFYKAVPVSEEPPGNNIALDQMGVPHYGKIKKSKGVFVCDNGKSIIPIVTHCLRPLSLAVPESVSDEAIETELLAMSNDFHGDIQLPKYAFDDDQSDAFIDGFKECRNRLLPLLASREEEVKRLRAAAEKLCSAITARLPNIDTGNEKDLAVYHALHELKSLTNTTPTNE